jgi:hypothetical protein
MTLSSGSRPYDENFQVVLSYIFLLNHQIYVKIIKFAFAIELNESDIYNTIFTSNDYLFFLFDLVPARSPILTSRQDVQLQPLSDVAHLMRFVYLCSDIESKTDI